MASLPEPHDKDWERTNAKSWELPYYGPGPDFGRGTIYDGDADQNTDNKSTDEDDEDAFEDINYDRPPVDYQLHPTSSKVAVTGRAISSVPPVPTPSPVPSQSTFQTRPVPTGSRTGRPQSPMGPVFNERGPNTGISNTLARPHYSACNLKPGQRTPVNRGQTDTPRPPFYSKKGSTTSTPSQHKARCPAISSGQNDSHSKAKWRKGFSPDASYRLPYECQVFQEKIRQVTLGEISNVDFRQRIIEETDAYMRMSAGNAKLVHIWGRQKQVLEAQNLLQDMVNRLMQQRTSPTVARWTKVHAHSNRKVAHARSQESHEERLSDMRKPPRITTDYTLAFLWPSDGPSLNHLITARRELLDSIRLRYDVNIYIKPGIPDYLFMSGNNERDMSIIASRFRELWERVMVQHETEIKLFLVAAPRAELMRTHVILQKSGRLSVPVICGPELAPDVTATWKTTADEIKLNNKNIVTTRLRKALHVIPQFRGFLQMRAKFGSFALQQWREPNDGTSYEFSEFREMLTHMNTEGRLLPGIRLQQDEIFDRIMESTFLKPWGKAKIKSLLSLMPKYSANFEYQVNKDSVIRVEAKFSLPLGSQEFEVNGVRCFKSKQIGAPVDRQMPMQISMIDFERSDWQLEVKALELCPEKEISPELDKFMRSIAFQWNPSAKSIGSVPQRKARFSYGAPVKRFVEKATIQLQVKDSPHVFELARFDEYTYGVGHWSMTPKVSWGASLFNPSWDDILGEQADVKALDISKEGCLSVFFPPPGDEQEQTEKPKTDDELRKEAENRKMDEEKQLGSFMSTVQQVARMLGNPGAEMPDFLENDLGSLF
ncbi:hypothetical protein DTO027I6_6097 [Penicillium roqueforti]|nr:hypothetical protein CBS147354_2525 [Penicillium roqueforti]KAI3111334.1 hypothetical protein CBS147333_4464 [Penicillium roqueforti]KAI3200994.1 hypothetical protein DTO027I6_6097 [Penicillium roqueforti]KAI3270472.1 hypothetical protein CBS147308_4714 [Penicillium roqueforti]KAI3291369.1 hypothetical protein DTO003C3_4229 [Penicillium roqueforti]